MPTAEQFASLIAAVKALDLPWGRARPAPPNELVKALRILAGAIKPAISRRAATLAQFNGYAVNVGEDLDLLRRLERRLCHKGGIDETALDLFGVPPPSDQLPWARKCLLLAGKVELVWPRAGGRRYPTDAESVLVRLLFHAMDWTGEEVGPSRITMGAISQCLRRNKRFSQRDT